MVRLLFVWPFAVLLILSTGCGSARTDPQRVSTNAPGLSTETSPAVAFDSDLWESDAPGEGHSLAAARDIVARSLLNGKTLSEVRTTLGKPDAEAIPLDYESGSAEILYDIIEGPMLIVRFEDQVVDEVEIIEPAGPPEEALKLTGVWEVQGDGPVRRITFRRAGFLTRRVEINGRLKWRVGNWRVIAPGKIAVYRPRWADSTYLAAVYEYVIVGDAMALTYAEETPSLEGLEDRTFVWTPWLAGEDQPMIELERIGPSPSR